MRLGLLLFPRQVLGSMVLRPGLCSSLPCSLGAAPWATWVCLQRLRHLPAVTVSELSDHFGWTAQA